MSKSKKVNPAGSASEVTPESVLAPASPTAKRVDGNRYRNRIARFEFIRAGDLGAHEGNFRLHPGIQSDAMRGMLSEIGWVNAVLAFEEDGKLVLFDGHLRKDLEPNDQIPVIVTDLTRDEANTVLATHDYITSLAEIDEGKLNELVNDIEADDASVRALLASLATESGDTEDGDDEDKEDLEHDPHPAMDLSPHEHYDFVVVLARTTQDWYVLLDLLGIEEKRDPKMRKTTIGLGRAIEASRLISILRAALNLHAE